MTTVALSRTDGVWRAERRRGWVAPGRHLAPYAVLAACALPTPVPAGFAAPAALALLALGVVDGLALGRRDAWSPPRASIEIRTPRLDGAAQRRSPAPAEIVLDGRAIARDRLVGVGIARTPIYEARGRSRVVQVGTRFAVELVFEDRAVRVAETEADAGADAIARELRDLLGCERALSAVAAERAGGVAWPYVGTLRGLALLVVVVFAGLLALSTVAVAATASGPERGELAHAATVLAAALVMDALLTGAFALAWRGPTRRAMRARYALDALV